MDDAGFTGETDFTTLLRPLLLAERGNMIYATSAETIQRIVASSADSVSMKKTLITGWGGRNV